MTTALAAGAAAAAADDWLTAAHSELAGVGTLL